MLDKMDSTGLNGIQDLFNGDIRVYPAQFTRQRSLNSQPHRTSHDGGLYFDTAKFLIARRSQVELAGKTASYGKPSFLSASIMSTDPL